jgi:hypothetical protein
MQRLAIIMTLIISSQCFSSNFFNEVCTVLKFTLAGTLGGAGCGFCSTAAGLYIAKDANLPNVLMDEHTYFIHNPNGNLTEFDLPSYEIQLVSLYSALGGAIEGFTLGFIAGLAYVWTNPSPRQSSPSPRQSSPSPRQSSTDNSRNSENELNGSQSNLIEGENNVI